MSSRWFSPIAAALALVALVAAPASLPAAKMKPAAPAKSTAAVPNQSPAAPAAEPNIGPIDTQAKHAFIIEADTGVA